MLITRGDGEGWMEALGFPRLCAMICNRIQVEAIHARRMRSVEALIVGKWHCRNWKNDVLKEGLWNVYHVNGYFKTYTRMSLIPSSGSVVAGCRSNRVIWDDYLKGKKRI